MHHEESYLYSHEDGEDEDSNEDWSREEGRLVGEYCPRHPDEDQSYAGERNVVTKLGAGCYAVRFASEEAETTPESEMMKATYALQSFKAIISGLQ
jgi:hypothetical protein